MLIITVTSFMSPWVGRSDQ